MDICRNVRNTYQIKQIQDTRDYSKAAVVCLDLVLIFIVYCLTTLSLAELLSVANRWMNECRAMVEYYWQEREKTPNYPYKLLCLTTWVSFQDYIASVMNERVWNVGKTVQRRKREVPGEKCVPVLHSSLKIPRDHPRDPTRASALRCRGLPIWTTESCWPSVKPGASWKYARHCKPSPTYRKIDQKYLKNFEMWCLYWMEKISWFDHVKKRSGNTWSQGGKEHPKYDKMKEG
jgi:hypothetical protein